MAHDPGKRKAPSFTVRSLSPEHPLDDDTPVRIHAIVDNMLKLLCRIVAVAKHESKTVPARTGFYPITLLANANGDVLCDETGVPVVVRAPVDVVAISLNGVPGDSGRAVIFAQPNELKKRSEAAKFAGTSVSTLKRAEAKGELRATKVGNRDTSYFMADLNAWTFKLRRKGDDKG
jgi:hypothetical protein